MTSIDTTQTLITLYRRADKATQRIVFPVGISLAGWTVELRVRVRYAATDTVLTTESADLVIESDRVLRWTVRRAIVDPLPLGLLSDFEVQRVAGDVRETIGGGQIEVLDIGQFREAAEVRIQTPGRDGWSPLLAAETLEDGVVLRVADWTGGGGPKPGIGAYLGAAGWVSAAADATRFATVAAAQSALTEAAEALSAVQSAVQTTTQAAAQATSGASASLASAQIANGAASASIAAAESATGAAATVATHAAQVAGDAQAVETARQAVADDRSAVQGLRDEAVPAAAAAATSEANSAAHETAAQSAAAAALAAAQDTQPLSAASWSDLALLVPAYLGQQARISASDTGSHTGRTALSPDADVSVPLNAGVYGAYALTAGAWRRDGDLNVTGTASGNEAAAGTDTTKAVTPSALKAALQFGPSAALGAGTNSGSYDTFTLRGMMSALLIANSAGYRYRGQGLGRWLNPGDKVTVVYVVNQTITAGMSCRFGLFRGGFGIISNQPGIGNNVGIVQSMVLTNTHASAVANELIVDTNGAGTLDIDYMVLAGDWTDTTPRHNTLFHLLLFIAKAMALPARDNTVRNIGLVTGQTVNNTTGSAAFDTLTTNGIGDVSFIEASGSASYARSPISTISSGGTATLVYRAVPIDSTKPITGAIKASLENIGLGGATSEVFLNLEGGVRFVDFTTTQQANRILWNATACNVRILYALIPGLRSEASPASTNLQAMLLALANIFAAPVGNETWTTDDTRILWPTPVAFVTGRDTRIFTRQIVKGRQRQINLDISLVSPATESDNDPGFGELLGPTLRLKGEQLKGSTCFWDVKGGNISLGQVRRRAFTRYLANASQAGALLFCMLGDSTAALALNALRNRVNASGATFTGVGTVTSGGIAYEGRAGWSSMNYLGRQRPAGTNPFLRTLTVANSGDLAILTANPTVCFANDDPALSYAPGTGTRTSYAADVAAGTVKATYSMFDFAFWRTNGVVALTGAEKLRVGMQLGRNGSTTANWLADEELAQAHIVTNFRAAFPNGTILVASETVGEANDTVNFADAPATYRERTSDLIALKLKLFSNRESDRVWLVPAWAMMNAFGGYVVGSAVSTDADTGTVTYPVADVVHYAGENAIQWAEAMLGPLLWVHQTT
ncbi:hypothetical protein [Ancylobacter sp. SL191]|uniref:hypothetical protein n=1 Tax=Ancylobacter sp. SL191 TaxID=2995166 RepID=UPI00226FE604|nr:hypothetical protein [Ancylobacter sp. SL191]WAC26444.1 hypothetical protein OU996_15665 [Ancylobacter sp. SL191]